MADINDNVFGVEPLEDGQFEEENTVIEQQEESTPEDGQVEETEVEEVEDIQQEEPQLILGKFKSQEDFEKAYKNLEAEYTRVRQMQQRKEVAPKQPEQPQLTQESIEQQFMREQEIDPAKAWMNYANNMAELKVQSFKQTYEQQYGNVLQKQMEVEEINKAASMYQDFYDYQNDIAAEITEIRKLNPNYTPTANDYENAYLRSKVRALDNIKSTAFENGKKAALKAEQSKKKTFNESPNSKNQTGDTLPEGINIVGSGDGIFI